jgi:polysaccharide export outer membrane protein
MPRTYLRWILLLAISSCLAVLCACASATSGAIDIEQFKDNAEGAGTSGEYVIGVGDMLNIQVYNDTQVSGKMRVRSDGRISLPLVNEVVAAGKTPVALAADLETGLKKFILNPQVTVSLEDVTLMISVLGEVTKPGPQPLLHESGVADALAAAGGLTPFAHKDRIFVIRARPQPVRIHFTYDAVTKGIGRAPSFRLRAGDVVVVE